MVDHQTASRHLRRDGSGRRLSAALRRLAVLETGTPWVRSLFAALPDGWFADLVTVQAVGLSPRRWLQAALASPTPTAGPTLERIVPVPGWTRFSGWSTWRLARALARLPAPRAIVHTIPWTSPLLSLRPDLPHVYRPHDHFGMYDWDQTKSVEHERRLMAGCRLALPISTLQADDLRKLGPAPMRVLPNGVSTEFVQRLREPPGAMPADLAREKPPLVGCVGQINSSYDVEWLTALVDEIREATFVFVGPMFDEGAEKRRPIDTLFARPNVRWLGPKPHAELPAYLTWFDVCLIPLRPNHANDRRSPLRLFDYLATGKPVLSTAIAAAREHCEHLAVGATPADAAGQLRRLLSPDYRVDAVARRAFVDEQTWNARAAEFAAALTAALGA